MRKTSTISILTAALVIAAIAVNQSNRTFAVENPGGASAPAAGSNRFEGKYCAGTGDAAYLKLIDESLAFLHANPDVPNLTMVYWSDWDTFCEGAQWGGLWIQNTYGFSYAVTPFLQEPWFSTLQRSWDMFWDGQADGKRMGMYGGGSTDPLGKLVGPDGCLGDAVSAPGCNAYKTSDGELGRHDWLYESTVAGVVMQAEILLASRDRKAIAHYLPKMARACDCVERTRDPKNNLLLVGPGCNLLNPSYGGVKQPDGSFGKGYFAGLSITYLAALDRMVELYKLAGDKEKLAEYERRQKITRESLPQLMTPAGYFAKSVEPGGVKHGVLGQKMFGYLEGVVNADAVGLRVADDATARSIYKQIAAYPAIRPFDFLLTNAPGLDDTYWNYGGQISGPFLTFGTWVNGGAWGTVEGRAILMYYRLGKFDDVRRSADRAMKWAKDFRMDAPWCQCGENTHNIYVDPPRPGTEDPVGPPFGTCQVGGVAVGIDNFSIPAATVRGLFDYDYRFDRLILRPRVPGSISEYVQKQPVRFGEKTLYLSCRNGGLKVKSVAINGKALKVESPEAVVLPYDEVPKEAKVEIVTEGGWGTEAPLPVLSSTPVAVTKAASPQAELPASLKNPLDVLTKMDRQLADEPGAEYDRAFVREAIGAIEAWRMRTSIDPGPGFFRPITPEKRVSILKFYEKAALTMYNGLTKRMDRYARSKDSRQLHIARLFHDAQQQ